VGPRYFTHDAVTNFKLYTTLIHKKAVVDSGNEGLGSGGHYTYLKVGG